MNPATLASPVFLSVLVAGCGGQTASTESNEVFVPAGVFISGADCRSGNFEPACDRSLSDTRHPVRNYAFFVDRSPVTIDEYRECVREGTCAEIPDRAPLYADPGAGRYLQDLALVSYVDGQIYCNWRGKRLPTPLEFERIARGVDGRVAPWGDEKSPCAESQLSRGCVTYKGSTGARSVAFVPQWVEGYEFSEVWKSGMIRGVSQFTFEAYQPRSFKDEDGVSRAYVRCARDEEPGGRLRE